MKKDNGMLALSLFCFSHSLLLNTFWGVTSCYKSAEKLLINFENVSFFSSAAINKLIVLEKRMRARGGAIRLSNLRPEVRDLFSYTNLDSMFQIKDEQSEAIDSFQD